MPKARTTDPQTSHEAAESVQHLTQTQMGILNVLSISRYPLTDQEIASIYQSQVRHKLAPMASESGLRSRRAELTELGLVVPKGFGRTASGRRSISWGLADA